MGWISYRTIRAKLIALIMCICFSALLVAGAVLLIFIRSNAYETIVREIQTDAMLTAENCNVALAFQNVEDVQKTLSSLESKPFIVFAEVKTPNGETFSTYVRTGEQPADGQQDPRDVWNSYAQNGITVSQDIQLDNETIGTLTIVADREPLSRASRQGTLAILSVIGLASILSALLAAWLQGFISQPILKLARMAQQVSATNDYSTRAEINSADEVGHLACMFNQMLDQIDQRDQTLVQTNALLEGEVHEREKAEATLASINQELKDFAYVVSHDLKAPLRGIKSLAEWIAADYSDKLDEEGREQLALMGQRVDRMRNLIEGILQYSRVGRVQEKRIPLDLNQLLPDIVDGLAIPEHIQVLLPSSLPTIQYEPTQLTQILQNLLSNAVKYMDKPEGRVQLECTDSSDAWIISIADNGPGIEEKYHEKIFGIFQTLVSRDTFESTGVGLAVVKKSVELAGGHIWVTSEVGKGSTFSFSIPKTATSPQTSSIPEVQTSKAL